MLKTIDLDNKLLKKFIVGIRPYRKGKIRLEVERFDTKVVVHNYGHGGAGFTLSLGSAEMAANLARASLQSGESVTIIGAGVIGLSTALALHERGHKVSIYASNFTPNTTSDLAGAQFLPVMVGMGESEVEKKQYEQMLRTSVAATNKMDKLKYGISMVPNYYVGGYEGVIQNLPLDLFPPVEDHPVFPFSGVAHSGKILHTFRFDVPIYMKALMNDVLSKGIQTYDVNFKNFTDLLSTPNRVIVNCTGLGAKKLCSDSLMIPFKGHLALFEPQDIPYFLIHRGYIFPRTSDIAVGGSLEIGRDDLTINPTICDGILEMHRNFYTVPFEEWKLKTYPWEVIAQWKSALATGLVS